MTKKERQIYEDVSVEVIYVNAEDVIATSGFGSGTEYVDPDSNAWVPIGGSGGWN